MKRFEPLVDKFYDLRIKRIKEREGITPIPQEFFAPSELIRTGICHKQCDMAPTGVNYARFVDFSCKVTMENYCIAELLHLVETGRSAYGIMPEHREPSPYEADIRNREYMYRNRDTEICRNTLKEFARRELDLYFHTPRRGTVLSQTEELPTSTPKIHI